MKYILQCFIMFLKVQTIDTKRSIKTHHEINQPLPATANWSARFRSRLLKDKTCWKNICSSWVILHFSTILSKSKFNPQTSQFTEQFLSSSSCFFVQLNHEPAKPNMKKKINDYNDNYIYHTDIDWVWEHHIISPTCQYK